ncbi:MAG: hypothetical protein P4L42_17555 [Desulfocapsaceae bacterium]|nr:hypothetical protein [Desulfocapsaceae bacterium]
MKKSVVTASIVSFLCCLSSIALGLGPEIDGFRGLKWGMSLEDVKKTKAVDILATDQENRTVVCTIGTDALRIGGSQITAITYLFWDNKLTSVDIHTNGEVNFTALKAVTFDKFGKGTNDGGAEEERFYWKEEISTIVLTFKEPSEKGHLHIGSRKIEEQLQAFQAEQARKGATTDF